MRFPRLKWSPDAAKELIAQSGLTTSAFERECRLRRGRLEELEESGWEPFTWELWRMSCVLDMELGELFEATYETVPVEGE